LDIFITNNLEVGINDMVVLLLESLVLIDHVLYKVDLGVTLLHKTKKLLEINIEVRLVQVRVVKSI